MPQTLDGPMIALACLGIAAAGYGYSPSSTGIACMVFTGGALVFCDGSLGRLSVEGITRSLFGN